MHPDEDILVITDDGTDHSRTAVADIRLSGRNTQGVRIMRIAEGSEVVAVARAEAEEEEEAEEAALDTTEEFVEEPTEDPSLDMNIADGEAEEPKDEI